MKRFLRFFLGILVGLGLAFNQSFAQAPNISYTTPVTLQKSVAVGTAPNPNIAPTNGGSAVGSTAGYSNTSTQPLAAGNLNAPFRGAVDQNGNLFVTNRGGGIAEFSSTGALITNNYGGYSTAINITGIGFDASGYMYVVQLTSTTSSTIYKIDPATTGVVTSLNFNAGDQTYGLAIDNAGAIYVADYNVNNSTSAIYKVPNTLASFAAYVTTTTNLNGPVDLGFDSAGELFVYNFFGGNIIKYAAGTPGAGTVFTSGIGTTGNASWGMRVDPVNNYVYMADDPHKLIYVYTTSSGTAISTLTGPNDCQGLMIDGAGGLYALDYSANLCYKYLPSANYFLSRPLPTGLSFSSSTGAITGTASVNSSATNYFIGGYNSYGGNTATLNLTVATGPAISYATPQVYTVSQTLGSPLTPTQSGGTVVSAFGYNTAPIQPLYGGVFNQPARGSIDASGNFYITNFNNNTVSKFTSGGTLVSNNYTSGATLNQPSDIAFDSSGNMYIMNAGNGVIQKFSASGVYSGSSQTVSGGIGLAIDANDNIYIASTTLGVYKSATGFGTPAQYLTNTTNMNGPVELELDASNNIYLLNSNSGKVYEYTSAGAAGTLIATLATTGSGNPSYGMALDAVNGFLYIYDNQAQKLFIDDLTGANKQTITTTYDCRGLFLDGKGGVYAPSFGSTSIIYEYLPTGGYYINKKLPGLTFSATNGQISGTTSATSSVATNYTITAYNASGGGSTVINITVVKTFNWTGTSSSVWTNTANWSGGVVPGSSDQALIGVGTAVTTFPIITANTSVGSIIIGTKTTAPTLAVSAGTLAVGGDITFENNVAATNQTCTISGAGSITATNLNVNTTGGSTTATYTTTLASTIANLTLTGDVIITSAKGTGTQNCTATLGQTGTTVTTITIDGVKTTNATGNTTTFTATGAQTTLNFTGASPLSGLSSTATNTLTLTPATIGYAGSNNQTVYTSFGIPNSSLSSTGLASYTNISFAGSGIKSATAGTLTVTGGFTNTLTNDASNYVNLASTIATNFTGASAQALAGGSGNGVTLYATGFSGGGTKTMSGKFNIASNGVLTMGASTQLATGGVLTLNSDANSSARIPALGASASITGNVNVQRFITGGTGKRGYRTLSSPVYGGTDANSNKVYSINYVAASSYITGTTTSSPLGIDKAGNPTLYLFRQDRASNQLSFTAGNFRGVGNMGTAGYSNLTYTMDIDGAGFGIPVGNGFLFFFRGDRSMGTLAQETVTSYIPTNTILTAVGTLNQGNITMRDWFKPASDTLSNNTVAGSTVVGYNLAGNPYASPISWTSVYSANSSSVGASCYEFNPITNNYGAYVQGSGAGTGGFTDNIGSGQGFFVVANTTGFPKLNFTESMKSSTQPTTLLMGIPAGSTAATQQQFLHLKLSKDTTNYDDIIVAFKPNASDKFSLNEDGLHLNGNAPPETLTTISADSIQLAIDYRSLPTAPNYSIGLFVNSATSGTFKFSKVDLQGIPAIYQIWLKDNLTKDSIDMRANGSYGFTIDKSNAATYGKSRFQLLFRQSPDLALHLLNFTGNKLANAALQSQLSWTVENESNYTTFYVQRSTDGGKTYSSIGSLQSDGSGTYTFVDKNPVLGQDLYRLQLDDINDNLSYSQVITLQFSNLSNNYIAGTISVFPNPAHDVVNVSINSAGSTNAYSLTFTNSSGTIVKRIDNVAPSSANDVSSFIPGTYIVSMIDNGTKTVIAQSKFVKL